MRVSLLVCVFALLALAFVSVVPVEAHVRLLYTGTPIRNAGTNPSAPTTNSGGYSVAGPCGGQKTYGSNGFSVVGSGQLVTLKIAYNGGHQSADNAFHAAVYCAPAGSTITTFDDSILNNGGSSGAFQTLVPAASGNKVSATDSSTAGYTLAFNAPTNSGNTTQSCVFALLDQRNWGGCVDVKLLPSNIQPPVTSTSASSCTTFCANAAVACTGGNINYASNAACMTACGNFSGAINNAQNGDTFQCRQAALTNALGGVNVGPNCALAAATPSGTCADTTAALVRAHTKSPCTQYCAAMSSNCGSTASTTACLAQCAAFQEATLGSSFNPPQGDNLACRLRAASSASTCASAAASASGSCAAVNPLVVSQVSDALSAVYQTTSTMCQDRAAAAANTIAGCCCLTGTVTVIHKQGDTTATVSTDLSIFGGEMCVAGRNIQVPQYNAAGSLTGANAYYNFSDSVPRSVQVVSVPVSQVDASSSALTGRITLGTDPFVFALSVDSATNQPAITLTNDVPSTSKPRVCSVAGTYSKRIDSSNLPADGPSAAHSIQAATSAYAFVGLTAAALLALMM